MKRIVSSAVPENNGMRIRTGIDTAQVFSGIKVIVATIFLLVLLEENP